MSPTQQTRFLKEASFSLFKEGYSGETGTDGLRLLVKGVEIADNHGLSGTVTGQKLNSDLAYLLATGKAGCEKNMEMALARAIHAQGATPFSRDFVALVQTKQPALYDKVMGAIEELAKAQVERPEALAQAIRNVNGAPRL
jgi:hypothetical protein